MTLLQKLTCNPSGKRVQVEAKVTKLGPRRLVIVVRDVTERMARHEAEKRFIAESTARSKVITQSSSNSHVFSRFFFVATHSLLILFHATKDAAANRFTRHEVKNGLLAAIGLSDGLSEMHEHRRKITTIPTQQALLEQGGNDGLNHQRQESSATAATPIVLGNDSSLSSSSTRYSPPPYSSPEPAQPTDSTSDQDGVMAAWISELDTTLTDTLNTVQFATTETSSFVHYPITQTLMTRPTFTHRCCQKRWPATWSTTRTRPSWRWWTWGSSSRAPRAGLRRRATSTMR
jgi:hypothetical protein